MVRTPKLLQINFGAIVKANIINVCTGGKIVKAEI